MTAADRVERLAAQFDPRSDRTDVWRGLALVLDTDAYLNLGYSGRFRSYLVGDPQARLVDLVVDRLAETRTDPAGERLLDLGCGRGEPIERAANRHGFDGIGVDLVPGNVDLARATSRTGAAFVVGDMGRLPIRDRSVAAAMSIDAIAYVPDRSGAYAELSRVLEEGGTAVISDLVLRTDENDAGDAIERFGSAWDIPPPEPFANYLDAVTAEGLEVVEVERLTPRSIGTFRKWSRLFLALATGPSGPVVRRLLAASGMNPSRVVEQVRAAHRVLPVLEHVLLVLER
ncbi:class I SAM-dependent methyltransferase [Halovivax limisalsi]|uniref:class I SAM-dependent methyltransferase n=1 Tax=Halovivax limisalsi TaxID=1453760 RepID=UPI001FFD92ED|nr:class I SAM-dependent methyltransferase [Halovivax limisalsi]